MKSTILVNADLYPDFIILIRAAGVQVLGTEVVARSLFSVVVKGDCIPDTPQVDARVSRSHEGNTSTLKIEWIPVASDSDDPGEEE